MTEQHLRWLTGFTEGDGSVSVLIQKGRTHTRVAYGQKDRQPLDFITTLFDGNVHKTKIQHELVYDWSRSVPLIKVFIGRTVAEHFTKRLNIALDFLNLPKSGYATPTIDWLVGFWDAEGWSTNNPELCIEQKEHHVLDKIQRAFGGTLALYKHHNRPCYRWYIAGSVSRELVREITKRSHHSVKAAVLSYNYNGPSSYALHSDAVKRRMIRYYAEHIEEMHIRARKYRQEHKEEIRAYHRRWREANKNRINTERRENIHV